MKKRIGLILSVLSLIVFTLLYFISDNKGYDYGLDCNFCDKRLPYNLKPHDGDQFSFTLKDEDDFELIGKGFKFQKSSFEINNLLAYGYNSVSVIVKCTDSLNRVKYLLSYETGYKSKKGTYNISFKEIGSDQFYQIKNNYKWFNIEKEIGYVIDRNKFLYTLGILLSLICVFWKLLKLRDIK